MVAKMKSSFLKNSLQLFCHKNLFNGSGLTTTTPPVSSSDRDKSSFINHPLPRSSSSSKAPSSSSTSKQNSKPNYTNSSNITTSSSLKKSKNHSNSSPNLNEITLNSVPTNNHTVIASSSNNNPANDRVSSKAAMNITSNHSSILDNNLNSQAAQGFGSRRTNEIEIPIIRKPPSSSSTANSYANRSNSNDINLTAQSGPGIRTSKSQNFYVHRNENENSSFSASQPYFLTSNSNNNISTPVLIDIQKTSSIPDSPFRLNDAVSQPSASYIGKTNEFANPNNSSNYSMNMNGGPSRFNGRYNDMHESDLPYMSELDRMALNHSKQLDELMSQKSASAMSYMKGQPQLKHRSRSSNGSMRTNMQDYSNENKLNGEMLHNNDTYDQQEIDFNINKSGVKPKKTIDDLDYTKVETISVTDPPLPSNEYDYKRRLNSDNLDLEDCVEKMDRMETNNQMNGNRNELRMVSDFDSNIVLPFDIVTESKQDEHVNNGMSRNIPINVTNSSLYNNQSMANLKLAKRIQLMNKQNQNNIINHTSTTLKSNSSKIAGDTSSQGPNGDLVSILRDTSNGNSFRSNSRQPLAVNGTKYSILTSAGRKLMNRKENRDEIERRSFSSSNSGLQARNYSSDTNGQGAANGNAKKVVRFADSLGLELENVITLSQNDYYDPQTKRVIHYNYNNNAPNNYYYSSNPNHITSALYGGFNSYNAGSFSDQSYQNRPVNGNSYKSYNGVSNGNYPPLNSSYGNRYEQDRNVMETGLRSSSNSTGNSNTGKYLNNDLYFADSSSRNRDSNNISASTAKAQEQQESFGNKGSEFKYDDYISKIAFGNSDSVNYVNKYLDEAESNSLKIRDPPAELDQPAESNDSAEKQINNGNNKSQSSASNEQLKTMPSGSYVLPIQTLMTPANMTAKALSNLEKIESKLNSTKQQFNSNSDSSFNARSMSQTRSNGDDHSSSFSVLPSNNLNINQQQAKGRTNSARTSLSASGNNINVVTIGSQVLDAAVQEASSGAEELNEEEPSGKKYTQIQVKPNSSSFDAGVSNGGHNYKLYDIDNHEPVQGSSFISQTRSNAAASNSAMRSNYKSNLSGNYSGNTMSNNLGSSAGSSLTSSPGSSSASYPSPNIKIHTRVNPNGKLESEV